MLNTIAIRREDLSKKGEKRVAIPPQLTSILIGSGHSVLVQSNIHPKTGEEKRAFSDLQYKEIGAQVQEDLSHADLIFGLKEIEIPHILENKAYFCFSHTHKGQVKNRSMLKTFVDRNVTLIDYELIVDDQERRILTSFTYFAGYAGMIDSLWTYGQRMAIRGIEHPFKAIQQSVVWQDLARYKTLLKEIGAQIIAEGTPKSLPPFITCFLGNGKTSTGAQEIYDILPVKEISIAQLPETLEHGSRNQVYKLVLDIPQLFRLKANSTLIQTDLSEEDFFQAYFQQPDQFESNMDQVFPYCSMWMNCILWAPQFPRLLTRDQAKAWYQEDSVLEVIGDITCDPEGAIEFSQETWIDQPTFIYAPQQNQSTIGIEGDGIAVMAVTNLPCEFPKDASELFGQNLEALLPGIASAQWHADQLESSGLPMPIQGATILWKGEIDAKIRLYEGIPIIEPTVRNLQMAVASLARLNIRHRDS